ncbi:MAG: hypothetical protein ACW967_09550 [Candidatus Hodarchaeales archaeon]|jgi:polyferredoxin
MESRNMNISAILLFVSSIGVLISGPLILGWVSVMDPFWDLGAPWKEIGGYLDIIGGFLQLIWLGYMLKEKYFIKDAERSDVRNAYKIMALICLIGLIADPLGGLLALSAQLGFYTSLINIYWHR